MTLTSKVRKGANHDSINALGGRFGKTGTTFKEGMNTTKQNPEHVDKGEEAYHMEILGKVSNLTNLEVFLHIRNYISEEVKLDEKRLVFQRGKYGQKQAP